MSNPRSPESQPNPESNESFEDILKQFERPIRARLQMAADSSKARSSPSRPNPFFSTSATRPKEFCRSHHSRAQAKPCRSAINFQSRSKAAIQRAITSSRACKVELPKDWSALEKAFAEKTTILGTVTAVDQRRPQRRCGSARIHALLAQRGA